MNYDSFAGCMRWLRSTWLTSSPARSRCAFYYYRNHCMIVANQLARARFVTPPTQLLTLEQEKLQLLEFIGEQGLRLPKQLRSALQRTPLYRTPESNKPGAAASGRTGSGTGTSSVAMDVVRGRTSRGRNSADGYAEEVDVEYTEGSSSSYYAHPHEADRAHSNTVPSKLANTAGGAAEPWERETRASKPMRSPASPKTKGIAFPPCATCHLNAELIGLFVFAPTGSSGKLAATYQPGEVFNRQSSNLRSGTTTLSHRDVRGGGTGAGVDVGSSWARSSGGSRSSAGRYDDAASDYEGAADEAEGAEMDQGEDFDAPLRGSGAHDVRLSSTKTSPTSAAAAGHSVSHSHSQSQSGAMLKQTLRDPHHHAQTSAPAGTATSATAAAADPAAGRTEQVLPDGRKIIKYKNGTEKEVDTSGNSVVRFLNGDTKSVNPTSGVVIYYYAQAETTHTTFKDGLEVYEFPNKQVEMHFPDGIKEIIFPDGTRKIINPDGMQVACCGQLLVLQIFDHQITSTHTLLYIYGVTAGKSLPRRCGAQGARGRPKGSSLRRCIANMGRAR